VIDIAVWLPVAWNGRFEGVGVGHGSTDDANSFVCARQD